MKILDKTLNRFFPIHFTIIAFLLMCLNSCNEQIQNNNVNNEDSKLNSTTQFNGLYEASNYITKI